MNEAGVAAEHALQLESPVGLPWCGLQPTLRRIDQLVEKRFVGPIREKRAEVLSIVRGVAVHRDA
jgi:hypothetical protein